MRLARAGCNIDIGNDGFGEALGEDLRTSRGKSNFCEGEEKAGRSRKIKKYPSSRLSTFNFVTPNRIMRYSTS
jgi:hypothetical protein